LLPPAKIYAEIRVHHSNWGRVNIWSNFFIKNFTRLTR